MPSIGDILSATLSGLGWPGLLTAIFFIFMVDAAILPALPEVFTVAFYVQYAAIGVDPLLWALALLLTAMAGELAGNGSIYLIVSRMLIRKKRMPRIIDKAVKAWADFLVVKGERVVLVNRFAPAVPLMGVFIAVCGWNVKKSFMYILVGSLVKYSLLLALVGYLNVAYDPNLAQLLTLALVVIVVAISVAAAIIRRKRLKSGGEVGEKA